MKNVVKICAALAENFFRPQNSIFFCVIFDMESNGISFLGISFRLSREKSIFHTVKAKISRKSSINFVKIVEKSLKK